MKKRLSSLFNRSFGWAKIITWPRLAVGFGVVLLLAVLGQVVLSTKLGFALGISLYVVAVLLFMGILSAAAKCPPATDEDRARIRALVLPFASFLASLMLLAYSLAHIDSPPSAGRQNYLITLAWVMSMVFFAIAVLLATRWRFPGFRSLGQSLRQNKWELIAVCFLVGAAFFVRVYKLDQIPYPFLKDEAYVGIEAHRIVDQEYTNLLQVGWQMDSLLNSVPEAASIGIFGSTIFGVRLAPVLFGTFTVLFLYFLARAMFDKLTAFLAALCLLGIPPHIHFSRMGVSNITVGFWAVLVFWLTYRAIKSGRTSDYLWAGLVTGLPLYSYAGARLISALGALMIGFCILAQRGYLRKQWRNMAVYAAILIIVAAPSLYLAHLHPETFMSRFRGDNIFSNHWLISEPVNSKRSIPVVLLDQLKRSTLVFFTQPAWGGFYNSPFPYLLSVAAVLFVFGWGYSVFHLRDPRQLLLQVWLWAFVILGSAIYAPAPSTERMIGSFPVAALFCAVGLVQLVNLLKGMQLASPRVLNGIAVGVMAIACLQGTWYYLVTYQQTRVFAHPDEEFEVGVSLDALKLGPGYRMEMLIHLPLQTGVFPIHDYLIPNIQDEQLDTISTDVLQALPRDKGMIFFALPDKMDQLTQVAQFFPDGKWREVDAQPIPGKPKMVLYYSYQVPPGTNP